VSQTRKERKMDTWTPIRRCAALAGALLAIAVPATAAQTQTDAVSRPYVVAASCRQSPAVHQACAVAIRYLRALDLDRFETACALLAQETLKNAGGMRGCAATLESARGTRIRYGILDAVKTVLGTSIRFRTRALDGSGPGIDQTMIVRPEGGRQRIWLVMIEP
jgi:hypothetical protein